MGNLFELRNFGDLTAYCREHPKQGKSIVKILGNLIAMTGDTQQQTEEGFVRLLYHLDPEMKIPAEVLRYIAIFLYPFYQHGRLEGLAFELRRDESDGGDAKPEHLADALAALVTGADKTGEIYVSTEPTIWPETDAESEISGDQLQMDDEMEILEESLDMIEIEEQEEILSSTAKKAQIEGKPDKDWCRYLKKRRYFFPEMKKAAHWTGEQIKDGYLWLHARKFYWPQIHAVGRWTGLQAVKVFRWVRDEQEYYVWLRSYQGRKAGYYLVLAKKTPKIRLQWSHRNYLKKIYDATDKDTLRVLRGILTSSKLSKEEREPLTHLKDLTIMKEKVLTQPATVLDAINYGHKKFLRVINRTSTLCNVGKLNKKIAAYYLVLLGKLLDESNSVFRKGLEDCSTYPELKRFMGRYPLYRRTCLKHYKSLKLILCVKNIIRDFEKRPLDLTPILNKHLGAHGHANVRRHLVEVLVNSHINEQIWEEVKTERYLESLQKRLKKIPKKAPYRPLASSINKMIFAFMSGEGKFTFTEFKAGLNFIPEKCQNKIAWLAKQKLQEDLNIEVNTLLMQHGKYIKRLKRLREQLTDPRYQGASISIFGYPPHTLDEKIASIEVTTKNPRHIFSGAKVPDNFIGLVMKAKKAEAASREKSVPNCLEMLKKIDKADARKERVNLHHVLVRLFKVHGKVNFATSPTHEFTGYRLAGHIDKFYNNPNRSVLDLSETILPEIRKIVEKLVDNERKRQLEKIKKYKDD